MTAFALQSMAGNDPKETVADFAERELTAKSEELKVAI